MTTSPSLICDFCSGTPVIYDYPTMSFDFVKPIRSIENWAACWQCSELIELERWNELVERCLDSAPHRTDLEPYEANVIRASLKALHQLFRQHRNGERRRIDN